MIEEFFDGSLAHLRRASVVKVDDSGSQQKLNLRGLASDRPEEIVRILPHGFSSNPPENSEGVLLALGGRSDRVMFLGGEHKDYRQKNLPKGTAVLYDHKGNVIYARSDKGILVKAKQDHVIVQPQQGKRVYLGGNPEDGHQFAKVMTEDGPSPHVYARIDG